MIRLAPPETTANKTKCTLRSRQRYPNVNGGTPAVYRCIAAHGSQRHSGTTEPPDNGRRDRSKGSGPSPKPGSARARLLSPGRSKTLSKEARLAELACSYDCLPQYNFHAGTHHGQCGANMPNLELPLDQLKDLLSHVDAEQLRRAMPPA